MWNPMMMMNPMMMNPMMMNPMMMNPMMSSMSSFGGGFRSMSGGNDANVGYSVGKRLGDAFEKGDWFSGLGALIDGVSQGWQYSAQNQALDAMKNWTGFLFPAPSLPSITIYNPNVPKLV